MQIKCPVCADNSEKTFKCKATLIYNSIFDLIECPECQAIFFNPLPTIAQLNKFYAGSYYNFNKSHEEGKGMFFAKHYLKKIKPSGNFLDVGCATGFFINGIKKHSNWDVYGTDFSADAVKFAKDKLNLNVRSGDLINAGFLHDFFDYIHVNNVIEHVLDPLSLFKECRRIIKSDGILMLSVPNGFNDSLPLIDFYNSEKVPARSKDGHIFFFSDRTLAEILKETGFEIKKKKFYSIKRGLRNIGLLPKKKDWKTGYFPLKSEEIESCPGIINPDEKRKHSDFYYYCHFLLGNLKMLPGFHKSGLDFLLILKPK